MDGSCARSGENRSSSGDGDVQVNPVSWLVGVHGSLALLGSRTVNLGDEGGTERFG